MLEARVVAKDGFETGFTTSAAAAEMVTPKSLNATLSLEPINFSLLSATLLPEAMVELDKVANFMRDNPDVNITIEGHTQDSFPASLLQKLSEMRAETVAAYLTLMGIDDARTRTVGYGDTRPLVPNDSAENRAMNRRIEILY